MRDISDRLCREYGLSVIEHGRKAPSRPVWLDERNGKPTRYNLMREAMEAALSGLLKRDDLGDAGGRAEAFARKAFSFEDVLMRFRTVFEVDKPAG